MSNIIAGGHGLIRPSQANKEIISRLRNHSTEVQAAVRKAWFVIGDQLKKELQTEILSGTKSGKIRRKRNSRRRHQASAPGETAANDTGEYRRSVGYEIQGWMRLEFGAGRNGEAPYSKFLEEGTSKMAPRPGLQNAFYKEQQEIVSIFSDEIRKRLT